MSSATKDKSRGEATKVSSATKNQSKAKSGKRKRSDGVLKRPREEGQKESDRSQCDEILGWNVNELLEHARHQTAKIEQLTGDLECMKGTLRKILERLDK